MSSKRICVIGGGGFVGHHLVSKLAANGLQVRVPARRRDKVRVRELLVLPTVEVVETDIHAPHVLDDLVQGVDAVINLVGILHGSRQAFERAHVELPGKVVAACQKQGVARLLHMSALGADPGAESIYQQTKAQGEALVMAAGKHGGLNVTAFRPSVIFGPGDSFLSLFADLLKLAPVVPLAGAAARFQPVYVQDVAAAFAASLDDPATFGQAYNLCGPQVYTLEELVRLAGRAVGVERTIIPLGWGASYLFARLMEFKPGEKLMTRDNYHAMRVDNVCPGGFPEIFGVPTPLQSVIGYLREADQRRSYDAYRTVARR